MLACKEKRLGRIIQVLNRAKNALPLPANFLQIHYSLVLKPVSLQELNVDSRERLGGVSKPENRSLLLWPAPHVVKTVCRYGCQDLRGHT